MTATVHCADVVLPMSGAPLRDGAVLVVDALVVDVGPRADVVRRAGERARVRRWRGVLLPGLVNAHTHLALGPSFSDLAHLASDAAPDVAPVASWRARVEQRAAAMGPDERAVEARGSVHAALRTGTTCVGDLGVGGVAGAPAGAPAGGLAGRSWRSEEVTSCPLAQEPPSPRSPVVLRTRSDALLGLPERPVARLLDDGTPVALGTESLASCPDLDLLAEARACRDLALRQGLEHSATALLVALTSGGAAVLGVEAGTLSPGRRADLTVVDVAGHLELGGTSGDGDRVGAALLDAAAAALVEHGAGRCLATVLAGRIVHRRG